MKCPVCELVITDVRDVKDSVPCKGTCKQYFHKSCTDIKDLRSNKGMQLASWKCPNCRPTKIVINADDEPTTCSDITEVKQAILSINETLSSLLTEVTAIKNTQFELQKSVEFCCNKVDDFQSKLAEMDLRVKQVESLKEENANLKSLTASLKNSIEELEQRSRIKNLEIAGIPEKLNENLPSVLNEIAKAVDCSITPSDIDAIHRVAHRNIDNGRPKNIIVALSSRLKKDELLIKARRKHNKGLHTTAIGYPGSPSNIYVNEHLSPSNKMLLRDTKIRASEANYEYVWVRYCKIFVRKNATSPALIINSSSDLSKLVA